MIKVDKTKLSATFIDDINNRRWTYDGVSKIETGAVSVFVHCSDESGNHVFSSTYPEFTRIEIEKENDDRPRTNADYLRDLSDDKLADWLCHQFWDDYDEDDVINIIRYNQVRNFLKMEHNDIK